MEDDLSKFIKYESQNSDNCQVIGKLMYSGETSKNSVTNEKIYDCIGLSFGKVRIIDDSCEAFYYPAVRLSNKDNNAKWIVIADNSPQNLMSGFISGEIDRTPEETIFEKKHIFAATQISLSNDRKQHISKQKQIDNYYVLKTPEQAAYREELMKRFAERIYPYVKEAIAKEKQDNKKE